MGKIVVSENVSLDGVVEDPTGEAGFARGGWFAEYMGDDREAWARIEYAEALGADALLHGRRTDEYFGPRWNVAPGEWADRLRSLPKYVVSSTITEPIWVNSTVVSGDVVDEVRKLKQDTSGEIVVYGSRQLVHTLLEHDLVDEVRLTVFPVVLGAGERLFGASADTMSLRLRNTQTVGDGLTHLTYEVVR
ncbi:dihydrofolate reductase family protein [Diaminobutyricibacter tongyongensis]|uniref:Dihydrofolate reductase family protein n=1 Tax=Leifsonia tongyongensis TaxID=1268043 RepID=A0A6L9XY02_9MICO|nr:dihydrofolate reductase family protein [Diaminobutyricibacter tongyongensis]NEN05868.1 dihydrofolate reductase family protein [Diaminobutyricibacter tongyongensis]